MSSFTNHIEQVWDTKRGNCSKKQASKGPHFPTCLNKPEISINFLGIRTEDLSHFCWWKKTEGINKALDLWSVGILAHIGPPSENVPMNLPKALRWLDTNKSSAENMTPIEGWKGPNPGEALKQRDVSNLIFMLQLPRINSLIFPLFPPHIGAHFVTPESRNWGTSKITRICWCNL